MVYTDNPAGRLEHFLRRFAEQDPSTSILGAWRKVFGAQRSDTILRLARVVDLVHEVGRAVDRVGEPALARVVDNNMAHWLRPVLADDVALNKPMGHVLPNAEVLDSLGLVSAHLHAIDREGPIPDAANVEALTSQLREVIDGVREADDIPDDVKHELLMRLRDVEEALQHIDVGGPAAVQRATEALVGRVGLSQDRRLWHNPTIRKLVVVAAAVWVAFTAGPEVQNSIDAWGNVVAELAGSSATHPERGNAARAQASPAGAEMENGSGR